MSHFTSSGNGGPAPGTVLFLEGNIGGQVPPDGTGTIHLETANTTVLFDGNPGAFTVTQNFGISNLLLGTNGATITSGTDNVSLGDDALDAITSGSGNIAIGVDALGSLITGSANIGIGFEAGIDVTGQNNTIIGFAALSNASNANSNTVVGYQAMMNTTGGNNNVILGLASGTAYTTSESNNVLLNNPGLLGENGALRLGATGGGPGQQSIAYIAAVNGVTVPNAALMVVIDTVTEQLGTQAIPTGTLNTLTGDIGGAVPPTAGNITVDTGNSFINSGSTVFFQGVPGSSLLRLQMSDTTLANTIIGSNSGNLTLTGLNNTGVGVQTLASLTTGTDNQAFGNNALQSCQDGSLNLAIGESSLRQLINGQFNTCVGLSAGQGIVGSGANTVVGYNAYTTGDGGFNTYMGFGAGANNGANTNNVGIGQQCIGNPGSNNVAIGSVVLFNNVGGSNSTAIGYSALSENLTGSSNIALGFQAGFAFNGSESNNIMIGTQGVAGDNSTIRIGTNAVHTLAFFEGINGNTVGTPMIVTIDSATSQLGTMAVPSVTGITSVLTANATDQFALVGSVATIDYLQDNNVWGSTLPSLTTGVRNIGIGNNVLNAITSAVDNHAFGHHALQLAVTGGHNIAIGEFNMDALVGGINNVAVGGICLTDIVNGSGNTAIGYSALRFITQGQNIGIGQLAGTGLNAGTENENIVIGYAGLPGESNILHIGTSGITGAGNIHLDAAFIGGIFGTTVGVSGIPVVVDNADQLGTIVSSERFKYDIKPLDQTKVLELEPVSFKYKKNDAEAMGLIAEQVEKVIPELVVYDKSNEAMAVKYQELPILLLAELKRLADRVKYLESKIS